MDNRITSADLETGEEKIDVNNINIPIDANYADSIHPYYSQETTKPLVAPSTEVPSFGETLKHSLGLNDINLGYQIASDSAKSNYPLNDPVPPNYSPSDDEANFAGLEQKYHGYVLQARSPREAQIRYYDALEKQRQEEYFNRGSLTARILGTLGAAAISPSTYIPLGRMVKAASVSRELINNIPKVMPGLAASAAAHEALVQTQDIGGSMQEFMTDTFRDITLGTLFMGAGAGLTHAFKGVNMWNARRAVNELYEGVELKPVVDETGAVTRIQAVGDSSVGAAKLDEAQKFADSTFAKTGLFAIPYISGMLGAGASKINPIVRMITSPFETMRGFGDRVASHGITTEGILKGEAAPEKFEVLMGQLNADNNVLAWTLKGLHLERNGIDANNRMTGMLKKTRARWKEDGYIDEETFGREVNAVLINEVESEHGAVNQAASLIRAKLDSMYLAFRKAYNLPETWMSPKTARAYMMRVYDTEFMRLNQQRWEDVVTEWLAKADSEIAERMAPIRELEQKLASYREHHDNLISSRTASAEDLKKAGRDTKAAYQLLQQEKAKLQNELRHSEDLRMHVEDFAALSHDEATELKELLKPLRTLEKEAEKQKAEVDRVKSLLQKARQSARKAKTSDASDRNLDKVLSLEKSLASHEEDLHIRNDKVMVEEDRLQALAQEGGINRHLYDPIPDSQLVKFKDPNNRLSMRNPYESNFHRQAAARAYYDTIMNQTAEDTIQQAMGRLVGNMAENPLGRRTLLIPDHVLYDEKFLSTNLIANVANYRNTLGRRTFLKNVFKDVTLEGGIAPIAERLNIEFKNMRAKLVNQKSSFEKQLKTPDISAAEKRKATTGITKTDKQIVTLDKQFKIAKEDMQNSYNKMMGKTRGSEKMRAFSNATRNFAVATKLGAVPLTMSTDAMGTVFKHGFWPTIRDGILPMLQNASNLIKQGKGSAYRENAAHAHLGITQLTAATSDRNWNAIAQPYTPLGGKISNGMEKMAHLSGSVYFTNQAENFLQRIVANIVQSKIMRYMMDYEAGTLKPKDLEKLLTYGIDPKVWSSRFIEGWSKAGKDGNGFGGFQSRYWEWADLEASNKISDAIYRATTDTVIRRGMFDAPFAFDDPWIAILTTFKGYTMASLTRYMIPLLQRPDAEKLTGLMLMMMAGATVTPLRRIVKGEDPIQDDDNMFKNAIVDSGVFSVVGESIELANVLTQGRLLKSQNDRYRHRTLAGALAGPVVGMGDDFLHVLNMAGSGNYNQTDLNKMARLVPFMQAWYLRGLSNKMVESVGLPETYADAARRNR